MGNSKSKGNSYEREIARRISKWITGSDEELVCWRNVHSGTVGTVRKKKGLKGDNVSGDFQCLDPIYQSLFDLFHFDSKCLGNVHLFLINPNNRKSCQLFQEWIKVVSDSGKKIPGMFVKATNDRKILDFIIFPASIIAQHTNEILYKIQYDNKKWLFKILLQDDFFYNNKYDEFIRINSLIKNFSS